MSYKHQTVGFEKYEYFVAALKAAGIPVVEEDKDETLIRWESQHECYCGYNPLAEMEHCPCCDETCEHIQHLRLVRFTTTDGKSMVVEEWFKVNDTDCDGVSLVELAVYADGQRPELRTEVLEPC